MHGSLFTSDFELVNLAQAFSPWVPEMVLWSQPQEPSQGRGGSVKSAPNWKTGPLVFILTSVNYNRKCVVVGTSCGLLDLSRNNSLKKILSLLFHF